MTQRLDERGYSVAVVGATGAVGRQMLATLGRHDFPVKHLRAMASPRSAGASIDWRGHAITVESLEEASFEGVDFALFSAGGSISEAHAPRAARAGAVVIDNTSAFRMTDGVPLVVPEVNPHAIAEHSGIIANPNCSTIQMVAALKPLHDAAGLKRVVVSTYQSASGAGQQGIDELMADVRHYLDPEQPAPDRKKFAHPLAFEVLPHIDQFFEHGYTREELKMVYETRKIMDLPELQVSATCVRVPVVRAHSEAVTADFEDALSAARARELLAAAPGVLVVDDPSNNQYPLARHAENQEPTYVGRIRQDLDRPNTLHFWVVSDNLLKGAALNAVQIAEHIIANPT
ncbi:MAG: aspartate-semialdehyde dehydrogenase [Myxococcota bacterium]